MAERERAVAFTVPWNCEAGPATSEELMLRQQLQRPVMSTIRLCGNDIDGDTVSCTGSQLATVFETIAQTDSRPDCVWHAADVDPSPGELARYGGNAIHLIGGIDRVVDLIGNRPQVDFGFFSEACFDRFGKPSEHVSAEGPSRKRSKDSRIEVVAFDSTFIEVTTDIEDILENLRDRFGGTSVVA
jgi:hypothetical protein